MKKDDINLLEAYKSICVKEEDENTEDFENETEDDLYDDEGGEEGSESEEEEESPESEESAPV